MHLPAVFNFGPLLVWLLVFFFLNQRAGENVKPMNAHAVFVAWKLWAVVFLAVGVWLTFLEHPRP